MAIHTMVDLETWDNGNDAMIVSIGAVKFDAETITDKFHVGIDPVDAERYGAKMGAGTILWWMDPERRVALDQWLALPKVDLFAALDGFAMWIAETPTGDQGSLWGNGATFDNVILASGYRSVKSDFPVSFRKNECYRTIKNRCKDVEFTRISTHHNAVDDAASQALHLQAIAKKYGFAL